MKMNERRTILKRKWSNINLKTSWAAAWPPEFAAGSDIAGKSAKEREEQTTNVRKFDIIPSKQKRILLEIFQNSVANSFNFQQNVFSCDLSKFLILLNVDSFSTEFWSNLANEYWNISPNILFCLLGNLALFCRLIKCGVTFYDGIPRVKVKMKSRVCTILTNFTKGIKHCTWFTLKNFEV